MVSLIRLTASDNEFTFLPEELFDCPVLEVACRSTRIRCVLIRGDSGGVGCRRIPYAT